MNGQPTGSSQWAGGGLVLQGAREGLHGEVRAALLAERGRLTVLCVRHPHTRRRALAERWAISPRRPSPRGGPVSSPRLALSKVTADIETGDDIHTELGAAEDDRSARVHGSLQVAEKGTNACMSHPGGVPPPARPTRPRNTTVKPRRPARSASVDPLVLSGSYILPSRLFSSLQATARICNGSVILFSPLCARSSRGGAQILMLYAHARKVTQQKLRRERLPLFRARGGGRLPMIDLLCTWYPVRLERCRSG